MNTHSVRHFVEDENLEPCRNAFLVSWRVSSQKIPAMFAAILTATRGLYDAPALFPAFNVRILVITLLCVIPMSTTYSGGLRRTVFFWSPISAAICRPSNGVHAWEAFDEHPFPHVFIDIARLTNHASISSDATPNPSRTTEECPTLASEDRYLPA